MSSADYTYTRKNGGTTLCYGFVEEDSNYELACEDEMLDGMWAEGDGTLVTWRDVCTHLEKEYCSTIEQIIAC